MGQHRDPRHSPPLRLATRWGRSEGRYHEAKQATHHTKTVFADKAWLDYRCSRGGGLSPESELHSVGGCRWPRGVAGSAPMVVRLGRFRCGGRRVCTAGGPRQPVGSVFRGPGTASGGAGRCAGPGGGVIYSVCMPISRSWPLVAFALACVEGADGSCRCGLFGQCGGARRIRKKSYAKVFRASVRAETSRLPVCGSAARRNRRLG